MPAEGSMRSARVKPALLACASLMLFASSLPSQAATVAVSVSGVVAGGGSVLASLCAGALDRESCARGQSQPATASVLTFVFADVEPGRYAALAFQDEVGDGVLRRSRMGRPLEPYGLSNGAGRARRPTFAQAAVSIGVTGARVAIRLNKPGAP